MFMNAIATIDYSHLRHIVMAVSLCVAVLTFLALLMVMIVTERAWLRRTIAHSSVVNRLKLAFALAAITGLLASVPFAWASSARTVVSFLVWELVYTAVTALATLCFAVLMARIATGQIEFSDYEVPNQTRRFDHGTPFRINPATGLPMNGAIDFAGNLYGWDSHSHMHHMRDL
jgi:hypothetical protein